MIFLNKNKLVISIPDVFKASVSSGSSIKTPAGNRLPDLTSLCTLNSGSKWVAFNVFLCSII